MIHNLKQQPIQHPKTIDVGSFETGFVDLRFQD